MNKNSIQLPRGVFIISLDFELIWGTADLFGPKQFWKACESERKLIQRLLNLFEKYNISATWCTLGHLFLDSCRLENGIKHPDIIRPHHPWCQGDWFQHDPCGDEKTAPLFYARSLIKQILECRIPQEIGSHSFSHVIFGDPGCTPETANSELGACVKVARELGVVLRSFAFPRNSVGHLETLRRHGFRCFRGQDPNWYEYLSWPIILKRLAHLADVLFSVEPPVVLPELTTEGLWNIPGSMILFPMHGIRRYLPMRSRVLRAIKGLDAAVKKRRIFHLWFHPTNLADSTEEMFRGLEQIIQHAECLRNRGDLEFHSMGGLVDSIDANSRL